MEDEKEMKEQDVSKAPKKVKQEPILLVIGALAIAFLGFTFGMVGRPGHMSVAKQDYAVSIAHKPGISTSRAEMGTTKSYPSKGYSVNGQITKIDGNTVTVKDGTTDASVAIVPETSLYKNGAIAKQADLQVGNAIMVQGRPNALGIVTADVVLINQ